jgi:hypothetical protein
MVSTCIPSSVIHKNIFVLNCVSEKMFADVEEQRRSGLRCFSQSKRIILLKEQMLERSYSNILRN